LRTAPAEARDAKNTSQPTTRDPSQRYRAELLDTVLDLMGVKPTDRKQARDLLATCSALQQEALRDWKSAPRRKEVRENLGDIAQHANSLKRSIDRLMKQGHFARGFAQAMVSRIPLVHPALAAARISRDRDVAGVQSQYRRAEQTLEAIAHATSLNLWPERRFSVVPRLLEDLAWVAEGYADEVGRDKGGDNPTGIPLAPDDVLVVNCLYVWTKFASGRPSVTPEGNFVAVVRLLCEHATGKKERDLRRAIERVRRSEFWPKFHTTADQKA